MDTKYIQRGRFAGHIDVPGTLQTMEVGEIWHLNPVCAKMQTVRNCCSIVNRSSSKMFSASCPGYTDPFITITRLR